MKCMLCSFLSLALLCSGTVFASTGDRTAEASGEWPSAVQPAAIADLLRTDDAGYDPGIIEIFTGRQCEIDCPPGGRQSIEPDCGPSYVDSTNGGCNTTPPTFEAIACGDTVCGTAGNFVTGAGTNGRDLDWWRFSVTTNSIVRWTCRAEFSMIMFLVWDSNPTPDSCPGVTLFTLPATTGAPSIPPCTNATIRAWVPPGTYFAIIGPRTFTQGTPCDSEYTGTLTCEAAGPCEVDCIPGATVSAEPPCGDDYIDETNGGCNVTPTTFERVNCNEVVCGTLGTYFFQGAPGRRDLDWWRLTVTTTSTIVVDIEADVPPVVILAGLVGTPPFYDPCQAQTVASAPTGTTTGDPCTIVNVTFVVNPGEYVVIATSRYFGAIPCGESEYIMSVVCTPLVVPCVPLSCPPGSRVSDEPQCGPGYIDEYNVGCNGTPPCLSDPDVPGTPGDPEGDDCFESAACGDVICGKVGTYPRDGGSFRDLDWYEVITTVPCTIRARLVGTFQAVVFLLDGNGGCPATTLQATTAPPCEEALATASVLPGTYWIAVATQGFGGVSCADADYVLSIECECSAPCELVCPPGYRSEGEPNCGPEYVDTTNPGCNGTPEVFTDLTCPLDRICGTSGTYTRGGSNFREQDWLRITLTQQTQVTWRFTTGFPGQSILIDLNAGCAGATVVDPPGVVSVAPCQQGELTACLEPGVYAILVQPQGFTGVPCGTTWFGELTCAPCAGGCSAAQRGDSDNSGGVDFNDINCFVPALVSLAAWEACPQVTPISGLSNYICRNDVNCDGAVDFDDIATFVSCLVGSACPPCP
jgi:hypothetical protein